jgi:hypothetical protein
VFASPLLVAQTTRQDRLDDTSIEEAARTLQNAIRSAVSQAGGDLERQHIHLVLAFSTGHFNKDPLGAQAARQIAWLLARDLLVEGDRVSCFAWEMSLWDHLQGKEATMIVPGSSPEQKQPINDLFPTTVQDGSQGGHDTERAIVEITQRLGDARDAVIVLLTNDAQSVAPKGQQTLGADNPAYQQVLQMWQRLPQVSESGASLVLPFKVIKVDGSTANRKLDVVMAAPQTFASAALTGKPRSEQVRERVTSRPPSPPRGKLLQVLLGVLPWVVLGALLIVIGVLIARTLSSKQPSVNAMKIQDEEIDISKVIEGQPICILAGENYKPLSQEETPIVRVAGGSEVVLAEFFRQRNRVELQMREAELRQINDEWVQPGRTTHLLKMGEPYLLRFAIRNRPRPTTPARTQEVNVRIGWVLEDSIRSQYEGG